MDNKEQQFRADLQSLINRYSMENGSNTPDFLLAEYLVQQLNTFDQYVQRREQWYGRGPQFLDNSPDVGPAA